jgi:hypothetical protein
LDDASKQYAEVNGELVYGKWFAATWSSGMVPGKPNCSAVQSGRNVLGGS